MTVLVCDKCGERVAQPSEFFANSWHDECSFESCGIWRVAEFMMLRCDKCATLKKQQSGESLNMPHFGCLVGEGAWRLEPVSCMPVAEVELEIQTEMDNYFNPHDEYQSGLFFALEVISKWRSKLEQLKDTRGKNYRLTCSRCGEDILPGSGQHVCRDKQGVEKEWWLMKCDVCGYEYETIYNITGERHIDCSGKWRLSGSYETLLQMRERHIRESHVMGLRHANESGMLFDQHVREIKLIELEGVKDNDSA